MTYAIAAAGTGGHVFPGLAVGESLVASGVPTDSILFVGGSRLESRVYPDAGFPFFEAVLRTTEAVGQVFSVFVITVAAAEVGIGLAIVLMIFRNRATANVDDFDLMRW